MNKNNDPLVSIIVPVYNTGMYLKECLGSIFNQTYKKIEVIIVNDCSTDDSLSIINDFMNKHNNIVFINHNKNLGLSESRNDGINICSGEYISFVDSDDVLNKNFVRYVLENTINTQSDLGISNYKPFITRTTKSKDENNIEDRNAVIEQKDIWKINNEDDLIKKTVSWGKIYKRYIFDNVRYKKGKIHEDEYIFHHIYNKVRRVFITDKKLYYYRQRASSIMKSETINSFADKIYSICERLSFIRNNNIQNKRSIVIYYLKMLTGYPIYGTFSINNKINNYYLKALRKLGKEFWFIKKKDWVGTIWFWRLMAMFPRTCYYYYKKRYHKI